MPIRYGQLLLPTNNPSARSGAIYVMVKSNVDDAKFTEKFAKIRVLKFFNFFFDENLPRVMDYHGIPNSTLYSW